MALLALQLVWLVALPPFRGMDEFEHVFKAVGTARGQVVVIPTDAARGTGAWFTIPGDVVAAARFECRSLPYTTPSTCTGTTTAEGTRVASAAGRYHPAYYAAVGLVARPFHGEATLYAMRLASIALCLLLLGLALGAVGRWARTPWPALLVLASCTPTVLYSSVVAAPNGAEMAAALAFAAACVGLLVPRAVAHRRFLATAAGVSGALLATLRPLGPVWCLLAVGLLLAGLRPSRAHVAELLGSRPCRVAAAAVVASTVQATWWVLAERSLVMSADPGAPASFSDTLLWGLRQVPVWFFQSVGAFPYRNQPTSPVVYLCYLLLGVALLVLGLRAARRRLRHVLACGLALSVLLPYAIAVRSYAHAAGAWQGRYGLPLLLVLAVLVGSALDQHGTRPPRWTVVVGGLLYATAQATAPFDVTVREHRRTALLATHAWLAPAPWLVLVTAVVAAVAVWWTVGRDLAAPGSSDTPQAAREAATQRSSSACASPESTA